MPTLYRTYRPQTFAEVTAQEHVKKTLQNQLKNQKIAHAYLFTGPRGIGKTTIARLLAKAVNCEKLKKSEPCNECQMCRETTSGSALDVFEIDAASHTGVDNVREIIDGVRFAPNKGKYKIYIIDEVHMLSTAAFNALLKTLEEPPAHAIFILATTEIHKVPATVVSRCQRFDFRRFTPAETVERLKAIAEAEKVKIADEVLFEIARHTDGCERDAESLLGQLLALGEKEINLDAASLVLPVAYTDSVLQFIEAMTKKEPAEAIRVLNEGTEQGMDVPAFLENVISVLRTVLFVKLGGLERFQEAFEESILKRISELSVVWSAPELTQVIEFFSGARRLAKNDSIPQLAAELAVMKICFGVSTPVVAPIQSFPPAPAIPAIVSKPAPIKIEEPIVDKTSLLPKRNVTIEEVRQVWDKMCERLEETNPSLLLILKDADLVGVENNRVEARFGFAFHAETVNRPKNKKCIDDTLSEILGTGVLVQAVHVAAEAEADEAVAALTAAFGG